VNNAYRTKFNEAVLVAIVSSCMTRCDVTVENRVEKDSVKGRATGSIVLLIPAKSGTTYDGQKIVRMNASTGEEQVLFEHNEKRTREIGQRRVVGYLTDSKEVIWRGRDSDNGKWFLEAEAVGGKRERFAEFRDETIVDVRMIPNAISLALSGDGSGGMPVRGDHAIIQYRDGRVREVCRRPGLGHAPSCAKSGVCVVQYSEGALDSSAGSDIIGFESVPGPIQVLNMVGIENLVISPDGELVAVTDVSGPVSVVQVRDLHRETIGATLCSRPAGGGVWSEDGKVFACLTGGPPEAWSLEAWTSEGELVGRFPAEYRTRLISWTDK